MREIKFRVYDTEKKELSYGFSIQDLASEMCYVVVGAQDRDELVWQQYTGLKDKNGKEIYEGDLILSDHWASQETMVVKWDQDACMFYVCLLSGGDQINMDESNKTVVGNVFDGVDK